MIKAIRLHDCTPYNLADISDCKKVNFIFGANGSGKSTISAYLAKVPDHRFDHCAIEWENENKDLEEYGIYVGIPAKKIGERYRELKYEFTGDFLSSGVLQRRKERSVLCHCI